jgi:hypothetical protein
VAVAFCPIQILGGSLQLLLRVRIMPNMPGLAQRSKAAVPGSVAAGRNTAKPLVDVSGGRRSRVHLATGAYCDCSDLDGMKACRRFHRSVYTVSASARPAALCRAGVSGKRESGLHFAAVTQVTAGCREGNRSTPAGSDCLALPLIRRPLRAASAEPYC